MTKMTFNCKTLGHARRGRITVALILFFILYISMFDNVLKSMLSCVNVEDISCFYSVKDDALPSAEGGDFSPSDKSIFFLETSCKRNLTSRQSCAIESAARAHPDYQINVLFAAPISKETLEYITLSHAFENVRFARIHIEEFCKNTQVEKIVSSGALNKSCWTVEHASDMLRYLTLYKWGGIYMDLDVVVAKRLDRLGGNWAARESEWNVAVGALAFSMDSIGREIAEDTLSEIQRSFRGDKWGYNGPGTINRVLKIMCDITDVTLMNSTICQGFEVYGPELFYPIKWSDYKEYFEPGILKNKDAYVYHVWNHLSKDLKPARDSPYAQLARTFCPSTYTLHGDQFGM